MANHADGERTHTGDGDGRRGGGQPGGEIGVQRQEEENSVNVFEWVAKSRAGGAEVKKDTIPDTDTRKEHAVRARSARGRGAQDDTPVGSNGEGAPKIREHAVVAMESNAGGEEMILTLADRGVLEEEEEDVLENVREAELQRNMLGRKRAEKAKPLWEEDGVRRGLLDKYDEEEEEATYVLGGSGIGTGGSRGNAGSGTVPGVGGVAGVAGVVGFGRDGGVSGQSGNVGSVKARLEEAKLSLLGGGTGGDYYTAEEMEGQKSKKSDKKTNKKASKKTAEKKKASREERKQRRLKKKALTADEIAEMEAVVDDVSNGGDRGGEKGSSSRHMGSREERAARVAGQAAAEQAAMETARGRFDAALARANVKSAGLRSDRPGEVVGVEEEEEEEEELAASMAKARAVAMKRQGGSGLGASVEEVAKQARERREKAQEGVKVEGGLTFTDVGEFARSIATHAVEDGFGDGDGDEQMEVDVKEEDMNKVDVGDEMHLKVEEHVEEEKTEEKMGRGRKRYRTHGGSREDMGGMNGDNAQRHTSQDDTSVVPSAADTNKLGPGLGSVLSLLKDRGELNKPVEWGGRANDSRNSFFTNAMGGYKDVFTGGRTDNDIAANVEVALTRKDEFGRIMTPKEAFRQFCHNFHGIQPSQNSKEKRLKQAQKELAQKRRDAGLAGTGTSGANQPSKKRDTPFVSLDGTTVKPGQRRE